MARKALGRGLDALLPEPSPAGVGLGGWGAPGGGEIEVDRIRPNPRQPRENFGPEALEKMARSLREHGMLQPVVVREIADGYELIAGERRWRAAQRAGLDRIPAVFRDTTPQEALELALIENLQRQDLNPVEEARAYDLLVREMGLTQGEVAARVGRDRTTVANYIRLLKLPEGVQKMIAEGALSMGHARALLGLGSPGAQRRLAEEAVARRLSVRQVEARVNADRRGRRGEPPRPKKDPDVVAAERRLTEALGTTVTIRGKERGRIEIRFTSLVELDRLYRALLDRNTSGRE